MQKKQRHESHGTERKEREDSTDAGTASKRNQKQRQLLISECTNTDKTCGAAQVNGVQIAPDLFEAILTTVYSNGVDNGTVQSSPPPLSTDLTHHPILFRSLNSFTTLPASSSYEFNTATNKY